MRPVSNGKLPAIQFTGKLVSEESDKRYNSQTIHSNQPNSLSPECIDQPNLSLSFTWRISSREGEFSLAMWDGFAVITDYRIISESVSVKQPFEMDRHIICR